MCDGGACRPRAVETEAGGLEAWREELPLPRDRYYHASAAAPDALFVSGGLSFTGSATLEISADVVAAPFGADGVLGTWQVAGSLPTLLRNHGMAVAAGRLYVAGGLTNASVPSAEVWSAPVTGAGTLGDFRSEVALPAPRAHHSLLSDGATLVVAGGALDERYFTEGTDELWRAVLDADGRIQEWQSVRAPAPLYWEGGVLIVSGRLFVVDETGKVWSVALNELSSESWESGPTPLWTRDVPALASPMSGLRAAGACDALLFVLDGGKAITAPTAGSGGFRPASRFSGAWTGFSLASSPSGRVYVTAGSPGGSTTDPVTQVLSTRRK